MDELQKRKTPRYRSYDYNRAGAYFITICTQNRQCILSRIVGTGVLDCPRPELTGYGRIAEKYIRQLNDFYNHISVDGYVIMPNHIHLLLLIKEDRMDNGQSGTPGPYKCCARKFYMCAIYINTQTLLQQGIRQEHLASPFLRSYHSEPR